MDLDAADSWRVGTPLFVRGRRWRLEATTRAAGCSQLRLAATDGRAPARLSILIPFDRPVRLESPSSVSRRLAAAMAARARQADGGTAPVRRPGNGRAIVDPAAALPTRTGHRDASFRHLPPARCRRCGSGEDDSGGLDPVGARGGERRIPRPRPRACRPARSMDSRAGRSFRPRGDRRRCALAQAVDARSTSGHQPMGTSWHLRRLARLRQARRGPSSPRTHHLGHRHHRRSACRRSGDRPACGARRHCRSRGPRRPADGDAEPRRPGCVLLALSASVRRARRIHRRRCSIVGVPSWMRRRRGRR